MSEYDFAIKDAERFVDMLQQRLTDLDVVNTFRIVSFYLFLLGKCWNSYGIGKRCCSTNGYVRQSSWRNIENWYSFRSLWKTIECKLEKKIWFQNKISILFEQTVADAVKIMSRKDSLIQIETANVQKLTDTLGNLLVRNSFLFDGIVFCLME